MFVMTSRVESFGIVAVEAMLNECLIISSLSPCLPEVFGDVATYYKSGDHNDLSEKIALNLNMSNHDRLSIKLKAKKRSQLFSWDICAARTVDFFSKIIERHNNENR